MPTPPADQDLPAHGVDPSEPGTVEVEFPDGTVARWTVTEEASLDRVAAQIEAILGAPGTLRC